MSRIGRLFGAVVLTAAATSAGIAAQGRPPQGDPLMDAERSRAIQARLAYIEANKASFVKDLLEGWVPFVDQSVYDPFILHDIAMRAPAWQVYGAWLAGDYTTMIDILRGQASAGALINAFDQPQAKAFASASANLGETEIQLVFHPIPPCRMVDTRGTGARTGILAAGASRMFDLTTGGFGKGQGAPTSSCTGLPGLNVRSWAVNITAVNYTAIGALQVYPVGGSLPPTSILNFSPGQYALANNGTVTGCFGCGDSIVVRALGSATDVVIDVMGYFEQAFATELPTSTPQYFVGPLVTIPASSEADVLGGNCPAGTILINGANIAEPLTAVTESRRFTTVQWGYRIFNFNAGSRTAQAWSICIEQPVRDITP